MNVLIVGGGGREHALAWKLSREKRVSKIFVAPGNGGTSKLGTNVPSKVDDIDYLADIAEREKIDLTIVGPEEPLARGIVDTFQNRGLRIFGPNRSAARIEGSKSFSKNLMKKYNIPTAEFDVFDSPDDAHNYIINFGRPMVIKADGLAAGKGVLPCHTLQDAVDAVDRIMVKKEFGAAGNRVVVEELLTGEEASFLAFSDGETVLPLATSQDHKPIYNDDKGPNTGGMGAYSPAPVITDQLFERVMKEVMIPTVQAMKAEGHPYVGILYAGLMISGGEPKVLEFNARFGDPEAQPLLMRLKSDLTPVIDAAIDGNLADIALEWDPRPAVCVVMASGGYPGKYQIGRQIFGVNRAESLDDVVVFHAGTTLVGKFLNSAGGRVLGVTALGADISEARDRAYEAVRKIRFHRAHWRTDIAVKAIRRLAEG